MSTPPIRLIERKSGRALLEKHCKTQGIPLQVVLHLIDIEHENVGSGRRHTLFSDIDTILEDVPRFDDHAPLKD